MVECQCAVHVVWCEHVFSMPSHLVNLSREGKDSFFLKGARAHPPSAVRGVRDVRGAFVVQPQWASPHLRGQVRVAGAKQS
eukprot:1625683-Rhodomonas_salina.5